MNSPYERVSRDGQYFLMVSTSRVAFIYDNDDDDDDNDDDDDDDDAVKTFVCYIQLKQYDGAR